MAETKPMEHIVVSGAALKDKVARITFKNLQNRTGIAAKIFHTIARNDIVVDDIIQTVADNKIATISFTTDLAELPDARPVVDKLAESLRCKVRYEDHLAKVSVVGVGMRIHTGVADIMFGALAKAGINIDNITTSEIKISCLIDRDDGKKALRLVHDAFELGGRKKPAKKKTAAKKTAKKKAAGKRK